MSETREKPNLVPTNCRVVKQQQRDRLKMITKIKGQPKVEMPVRTYTVERECWLVPPVIREALTEDMTHEEQLAMILNATKELEQEQEQAKNGQQRKRSRGIRIRIGNERKLSKN